jgi:hypothetical protein
MTSPISSHTLQQNMAALSLKFESTRMLDIPLAAHLVTSLPSQATFTC